ncbi:MAG: hypothetical protein ABL924_05415 [Methyloglobulus sp.]
MPPYIRPHEEVLLPQVSISFEKYPLTVFNDKKGRPGSPRITPQAQVGKFILMSASHHLDHAGQRLACEDIQKIQGDHQQHAFLAGRA